MYWRLRLLYKFIAFGGWLGVGMCVIQHKSSGPHKKLSLKLYNEYYKDCGLLYQGGISPLVKAKFTITKKITT